MTPKAESRMFSQPGRSEGFAPGRRFGAKHRRRGHEFADPSTGPNRNSLSVDRCRPLTGDLRQPTSAHVQSPPRSRGAVSGGARTEATLLWVGTALESRTESGGRVVLEVASLAVEQLVSRQRAVDAQLADRREVCPAAAPVVGSSGASNDANRRRRHGPKGQ